MRGKIRICSDCIIAGGVVLWYYGVVLCSDCIIAGGVVLWYYGVVLCSDCIIAGGVQSMVDCMMLFTFSYTSCTWVCAGKALSIKSKIKKKTICFI